MTNTDERLAEFKRRFERAVKDAVSAQLKPQRALLASVLREAARRQDAMRQSLNEASALLDTLLHTYTDDLLRECREKVSSLAELVEQPVTSPKPDGQETSRSTADADQPR